MLKVLEKADWDESKHPRGDGGKWTDSGGGDGESDAVSSEKPSSHGIKGLPLDIKVKDRLLQQVIDRGGYTITAKEIPAGKFQSGGQRYELTITAKIPSGVEKFQNRPERESTTYYNPKLANLKTFDAGEKYLEHTIAQPKPGLTTKIEPLPGDDIIYRGMRAEEYEKFLETGKIESTGEYNIGGVQEGLTYWSKNADTAASYANSFAPWPHKATFEKPAYVVATRMPKETRHVPGVDESEVGVERAVTKDEVVGVWRGEVYEHSPGKMDLVPTPQGHYQLGGGVAASSSVVWQRENKVEKDWDESLHPRDDAGRFGFGGGGADSDEGGGGGKGEHPGKGYSKGAYVDSKGVIQTSSVYDAQRALSENRKVELDQPRKVSVLLEKLGAISAKMIKQGKEAPTFNLCNVSVKGTNLFCADSKGIERVKMPQLDKQQTKDFRKYLKDKGYKVTKEKQFASHLRATQNELNGAKVAAGAKKIEDNDGKVKPIIISKDDYILDGHHAWGAKLGLDAADNKLENDTKMHVHRVNISITKLLAEAEKFTGGKGHKEVGEKSFNIGEVFREWDESLHPRDEAGRFGFGGGGSESEGGASAPTKGHAFDYPKAGDSVDGLRVTGNIPNTGSIESSLTDYTVLPGVREVPMSAFGSGPEKPTFYSKTEKERTERLAEAIKESGEVDPLIVVVEEHNLEEGPYVLEGVHRFDALRLLDKISVPALVVIDHEGGNGGAGKTQEQGRTGSGEGGAGGARSASEAQAVSEKAASGQSKLEGLPSKPLKVGGAYYVPGPFGKAKVAAETYMAEAGLPYNPATSYQKVDPARATRIAAEFEKMRHDPGDPAVKASYAALAKEVVAQYRVIERTGLKIDFIKPDQPDPYAETPRLAAMDVIDNNHLWVFPTDSGFGTGPEAEASRHNNPMLQMTDVEIGGKKLMVNDVFRIVHDYFGHFKEGVGFRADGEDNAWQSHVVMFSEAARGAMTSETRGQNSWVNYGPFGEANRTASAADTHYAPQKIGLMPEWTHREGLAKALRLIYVRSHLIRAHHAIALMEAEGFDIVPYDGEYIPGTELIDTREWDESLHPRDDAGRFGFGGGGSEGGGEVESTSAKVPTKEQYDSVTKSPEFKRWFGNSEEVTKPDGSPMVLYHGGTHEYREFASKMANPEGNWGAGFYFSNSPKDVNVNYAGVGADLDVKIERETERILDENSDMSSHDARREAMKNIVGSGGLIFPVYVKMEKPFITGGDNETRLDFDAGYNPDTEEYDKPESGAVIDFIRGIREAAQDFGDNQANLDSLVGKITDAAIDGDIKASKLEALFREDDHIGYLEGDDGKLVSNEVFRRGLEEAGFDGVIDVNVAKKFHMEGMDKGTFHYIVFEPTQIKSAIGNSGSFDPKDPDITKDWDEGKHPREPAGSSTGGQFGSGGGGGESEAEAPSAANDYGLSTKEKADLKVFGGGIKVDWKDKKEYDALRLSKDFGETLDKLPKQTGTFYRGMVIPKKEAEQFVSVGGTITIAKHSFASPQRDYAKSFAQLQVLRGAKGSIPIVISIKNANAVAFGKAGYGASKNRLEVVLPIGDKMRITSVRETVINDVKGYNVVAEYV